MHPETKIAKYMSNLVGSYVSALIVVNGIQLVLILVSFVIFAITEYPH